MLFIDITPYRKAAIAEHRRILIFEQDYQLSWLSHYIKQHDARNIEKTKSRLKEIYYELERLQML